MNVGVDFGSTFSEFAVCNGENGMPEALELGEGGSKFVPTVACETDGEIYTGFNAREYMGDAGVRRFKTCKMLLNAKPEEWKRHDSYCDEFPPERIAGTFLSNHFAQLLEEQGESQIENLVICVPEIWTQGMRDPDPKEALMRICQKTGLVAHMRVVTEPEAASAYSAFNYQRDTRNKGKNYEGMILIIDYGGGTLDITLTQVGVIRKDGKEHIEITSRGRCGAGENHGGEIGVGGVAYMTRVTEMAILKACPQVPSEELRHQADFSVAMSRLESSITSRGQRLKMKVDFQYSQNLPDMASDEEVFATIRYQNKSIPVTYAMLYQAYQEVVAEELDKQLKNISSDLESWVKDPYNGNRNDFKIVLVGGFSKFAFVQRQVREFYRITDPSDDNRLDQSIIGARESAIAFGAALIADGRVSIQKTAHESLGLVGSSEGKRTFYYAITAGQVMESGKVYYIRYDPLKDKPSENVVNIHYNPSEPLTFAIGGTDLSVAYPQKARQAYWNRFQGVRPGQYAFGFRMDESGVIYLVLSEYRQGGRGQCGMAGRVCKEIRLNSYNEIFDSVTFLEQGNAIYK